jgi:hypothetical protein
MAGVRMRLVESRGSTAGRYPARRSCGSIPWWHPGGRRWWRSRVGQVIRRHVHGLYGGDGTALGGGDALLHGTHLGGQGGLVTLRRRRHTAQQCRYFGTGLGEAEDVVHEEEDVATAALLVAIAEVLGQGETAEGHTGTGSGRLVHLAEHEGGLALASWS